jgi:hypothetical protein
VPDLTTLTPATAVAGAGTRLTVQIKGTGFGPWSEVKFNNVAVGVVMMTSIQLNIVLNPKAFVAGSYPVTVFNSNFASNTLNFTFT